MYERYPWVNKEFRWTALLFRNFKNERGYLFVIDKELDMIIIWCPDC